MTQPSLLFRACLNDIIPPVMKQTPVKISMMWEPIARPDMESNPVITRVPPSTMRRATPIEACM